MTGRYTVFTGIIVTPWFNFPKIEGESPEYGKDTQRSYVLWGKKKLELI
jgi:hypothetical protein